MVLVVDSVMCILDKAFSFPLALALLLSPFLQQILTNTAITVIDTARSERA
jgi:hypothetical protein